MGLPDRIFEMWKKLTSHQFAVNLKFQDEQKDLTALFNKNKIPFAILKGTSAAMYYPAPSLRAMGDIDFIVSPSQYDTAVALMRQNGYTDVPGEKVSFRHVSLQKNGVRFELHKHFAQMNDADKTKYVDDCIYEGLNHIEIKTYDNFSFPMLPSDINGLVLLEHIGHHLESGIGLRHIMDWIAYVKNYLHDEQWNDTFSDMARNSGLDTLAMALTKMGQIYFGLSEENITWCNKYDKTICRQLLDLIYEYGNFGSKNIVENKVASVLGTAKNPIGFLKSLQETGQRTWSAYKKHRWLKPFAWIYQLGRFASRGFKNRKEMNFKRSADKTSQRVKLFEQLGVYREVYGIAKYDENKL